MEDDAFASSSSTRSLSTVDPASPGPSFAGLDMGADVTVVSFCVMFYTVVSFDVFRKGILSKGDPIDRTSPFGDRSMAFTAEIHIGTFGRPYSRFSEFLDSVRCDWSYRCGRCNGSTDLLVILPIALACRAVDPVSGDFLDPPPAGVRNSGPLEVIRHGTLSSFSGCKSFAPRVVPCPNSVLFPSDGITVGVASTFVMHPARSDLSDAVPSFRVDCENVIIGEYDRSRRMCAESIEHDPERCRTDGCLIRTWLSQPEDHVGGLLCGSCCALGQRICGCKPETNLDRDKNFGWLSTLSKKGSDALAVCVVLALNSGIVL